MSEIIIEIPFAVASLNEWRKWHHQQYKKYREDLAILVRHSYGPITHKPIQNCVIIVYRHGARDLDYVNLYGSFKALEDVLVVNTKRSPSGLGIIQDDSPKFVKSLTVIPVKCKRVEEKTIVKIIPIT